MHIQFKKVSYTYKNAKKPAANDVQLEFGSSEALGLIGENGSGKSTIIKILVQQILAIEGSYLIDDEPQHDIYGDILSKYRIGYLPEEIVLDDVLTGHEIAEIVGEMRSLQPTGLQNEIEYLSEHLRIDKWFYEKKCGDYSQGMRKKVGLLIAFLGNRRFVILDEPTNYLDALSVLQLKRLIQQKIVSGCGVLISSHIIDFVNNLVKRIVVLRNGRVVHDGTIEELHAQWPDLSIDEIFMRLLSNA